MQALAQAQQGQRQGGQRSSVHVQPQHHRLQAALGLSAVSHREDCNCSMGATGQAWEGVGLRTSMAEASAYELSCTKAPQVLCQLVYNT